MVLLLKGNLFFNFFKCIQIENLFTARTDVSYLTI